MDNLQTLKLSDNFDMWRDLINKAITHVNDLYEVPSIPEKNTSWQIIATNLDPTTNEYTLQWRDIRDFLNKLGIMTESGDDTDVEVVGDTYYPKGMTVGNYIKLYPTGDIENSGNITTTGITASEEIISNSTISGNKITSSSTIEGKNIELTADTPYIDFNYGNTVSDFTSRIIENKRGVLTINGNEFSANGSSIHSDLRLFTTKNDIIFRNDDVNFYILTSGRNGTPTNLRPFTMNISTGLITMSNGVKTSTLQCTGGVTLDSTLAVKSNVSVGGTLSVNGGKTAFFNGTSNSITGDLTIGGTLKVSSLKVDKMALDASSLLINPNIHTGANSSFESNVYIKPIASSTSTKSLVLRNDGSYAHLLVADTLGNINTGSFNSLRPLSFSMSTGDITMSHKVSISGTLTTKAVTMNGALKVNSNIDATGYIKGYRVHNAVFNDYAEFFERGEETEVGDIISLDMSSDEERYVKATNPRLVVGVHSDTYGHILGGTNNTEECEKTHIPVGLSGRVKTKIVGSINKGDEVILSNIPGVGRKFNPDTDRERDIIGFAVETNLSEDIKLVKIKI